MCVMAERFCQVGEALAGVIVLQRQRLGDERGFLERLFDARELEPLFSPRQVQQVNRTSTVLAGSVRGMHFQRGEYAEAKIIACLHGEVFDVAVDVRENSPTYLHWHAEILSGENRRMMFIPEGFAHGFQALTDHCELAYVHSQGYEPAHEAGLHPEDPAIGVAWPRPVMRLSTRDASQAFIQPRSPGAAS